MTRDHSDRNLLYSMLALQLNFVTRDALLSAMQAWVFDKGKPLGQILHEQGQLAAEHRQTLDQMVLEHFQGYDETLARPAFDSLADPEQTQAYQPSTGANSGRYRILRPHAQGGLGEVFVALDQEVYREVALKEIQPRYADDAESRGRFVQEAEITGGLEHPGIVPVYGLGVHADGRPYYAMRFIQGETLKDAAGKLRDGIGGVTLRGLLTRFVAVCNTIAYAHSRGVLHRDLKPSNVLLGKYGETLVIDWGLAKAAGRELIHSTAGGFEESALAPRSGDSSLRTQMGSAIGTPPYMSPEQATGRLEKLGPASDIYGLGATLYTILTGRAPVSGHDTAEVLEKVRKGEWRTPRQVNERTPPALDAVCRKAMALRAEDRYATALDLAADIEAWLASEPVRAWREPWTLRARRWLDRHRTLVTTAAAAVLMSLLALGLGVVLLAGTNERERHLRAVAEQHEQEARERGDEVQRQRNAIQYNLYVANMNLAQQEWGNGNLAHMRELVDACIPQEAGEKDLRGWEWHYLNRLRHGELRVLQGQGGDINGVAYGPDGDRLASVGDDHLVRLWDAATGQQLRAFKGHTDDVLCIRFSRDGSRLASAGRDKTVRVWPARGGAPRVLAGHASTVHCLAFSPDGARLASGDALGVVRVWDLADNGAAVVLKGHKGSVYALDYSPDGSRLATAGSDGAVRIWDAGGRGPAEVFPLPGGRIRCLAYSPDGSRLAIGSDDTRVRIWDAAKYAELRVLKGHTARVNSVAFSRDGLRLASCGFDGSVRIWNAVAGVELFLFRGHTGEVNSVDFSPDGTRVVSVGDDETVRIWDPSSAGGLRALKGHTNSITCLAFRPDGKRLASGSHDQTVRLWDPVSGRQTHLLTGNIGPVRGLTFSPDGARLLSVDYLGSQHVWDAAGGRLPDGAKVPGERLRTMAYSRDSRLLAAGGEDGPVWLGNADASQPPRLLKGHTNKMDGMAFRPDGAALASCSHDGAVFLWDVVGDAAPRVLQGRDGYLRAVAFSPDGTRLASAGRDGFIRIWDLTRQGEPEVLKGHTGSVHCLAYSPDGSRLASGGRDGTLHLWDPVRGVALCVLKTTSGEVSRVAFSPEGMLLAWAGTDGVVWIDDARPWKEDR
jgi:WD40 repeat protein/tRNA A-37 threonylcarbamoyl transferase component Bud32